MFILSWLCPQKRSTVWGRLFHLTFLKNILERSNRKTAGPKEQRRHLSPTEQFKFCGKCQTQHIRPWHIVHRDTTNNGQIYIIYMLFFFFLTLLTLILDYCNRVCYVCMCRCVACADPQHASPDIYPTPPLSSRPPLRSWELRGNTPTPRSCCPCSPAGSRTGRDGTNTEREIKSMQHTWSIL